tara:strand:- start:806 stop:1597 length:792 start_codon:yes stop_codon:yes gene_type:complete
MIEFPNSLKPFFVDNEDLIRLGSIDDGGYVVPIQTVNSSKVLLSFGISDNWEFEKDFLKKTSAKLLAYDHTIDKEFWLSKFKKDLIKFIQLKIFKPKKLYKMFQYLDFLLFFKMKKNNKFYLKKIGKCQNCLSLNDIITNHIEEEKLFLKIDIEGSEYDILEDIISNKSKIQGIVIEFHEVSKNLDKIINFTNKLNTHLYLVHIHANNYSIKELDQFPEAIEITYSKKNLHLNIKPNEKKYPLKNLDHPNSKRSPDIKISFVN